MTMEDRVAEVFDELFGVSRDRFSPGLEPQDVSAWDSVGHMNLVNELEQRFGQQFEIDEIMEMTSSGKIIEILKRREPQP
jgi:acyl carrier protein